MVKVNKVLFKKRSKRNRYRLRKHNKLVPRLSVHRSNLNIYAQVIDDAEGKTIVSASSLDKKFKEILKYGGNIKAAEEVGAALAERAIKAGIKNVVFDRGGFLFHGRVKALAESARSKGLKF